MVEIEFNHEQDFVIIQCNLEEIIKNIIHKYVIKTGINIDLVYFLYNGINIDKEKTLNQIINTEDKNRKKMNILVTDFGEENTGIPTISISKTIICPQCKKTAKINIKEYKIILECQSGHKTENIFLNKFKDSQRIDLSNIICDECHQNDKSKAFDNIFFRCNICKKNLCPACKSVHNKEHLLINYDDKDYICDLHNEKFTFFCQDCERNICIYCENNHLVHKLISYGKILPNLNKVEIDMKNLRGKIDKIKNITNVIINRLNKVIDNYEIFYNILLFKFKNIYYL